MSRAFAQDDHPNFTVQREKTGTLAAGAAALEHFMFFQKSRVRALHVTVLVAGTATATPADAALLVSLYGPGGTTSISNFFYSTNTAMHVMHTTETATVAANNGVRFQRGNDATGVQSLCLEYEVLNDATQS